MSLIRKHGAVLQAWACLALVLPNYHQRLKVTVLSLSSCGWTRGKKQEFNCPGFHDWRHQLEIELLRRESSCK